MQSLEPLTRRNGCRSAAAAENYPKHCGYGPVNRGEYLTETLEAGMPARAAAWRSAPRPPLPSPSETRVAFRTPPNRRGRTLRIRRRGATLRAAMSFAVISGPESAA